MPTAACYVRVSTEHQRENYSIAEQTDRLTAFCAAKDITIGRIYTDGGYSGGTLRRPALQDMLSHLPEYDVVIVYKLDRLSRSQKDTLLLIEDYFLAKQVDFISVCENFDTSTPLGRAMIGMLSVFAQLEKEQITERFTMGRLARAKNGYYHGGPTAPTGYDYRDGRLIVNESEAAQVRELFERFRQGHSVCDCQRYMQAHYTTKYGNWKSDTLIRNVLQNEVYIGKVKFQNQTYPGCHTPIIPESLFYEVQEIFRKRRESLAKKQAAAQDPRLPARHPFVPRTLLSGLLYCGKCGARFYGGHGNYSCSGKIYGRDRKDAHCVGTIHGSKHFCRSGKAPVSDKSGPDSSRCQNKKWKITLLDACVIDALCKIPFEKLHTEGSSAPPAPQQSSATDAPSAGAVLRRLLTQPPLSGQRACLALLVDRIYVEDEEITILLRDIF